MDNLLDSVGLKIIHQNILLVGGFGESRYPQARIRQELSYRGVELVLAESTLQVSSHIVILATDIPYRNKAST